MTGLILTKPLPIEQKLFLLVQRQVFWLRLELAWRLYFHYDVSQITPLLLECLDYLDAVRVNGDKEGASNGTGN